MAEPQLGPMVPDIPAIPPTHKILTGRTVTLEPLSPAHSSDLFACLGGAENARIWDYMSDGPFFDEPTFANYISKLAQSQNPLFFAIIDHHSSNNNPGSSISSRKATGLISLMRIDIPNRVVEIGYVTFSSLLRRTTAATETIYLLLKWVFEELHFRRCEWKSNDLNGASKRAAERLGFVFEGLFRQHMIRKGRNRDSAWFSMLDGEWEGGVKRAFEGWLDEGNFDGEGRQKRGLEEFRRVN
ncbi:hypothetical protein FQN55_002443 [Onygenales sp. PD_40]|nr:hypothetical protein FQN55_002443 [Onygenales sp. PD_40]